MIRHAGKRTLVLENRPRLLSHAAAVGKKEGEGPLGSRFDFVTKNDRLGQKSWELAESELQKTAIDLALRKGGLHRRDLDLILAGDLLNQCIGATFGVRELGIPYLGIYGACSNMAEGLLLSAFLAESGLRYLGVSTASHFCTAERQFRYPNEYGVQKPETTTYTVTGAGAMIFQHEKTPIRLTPALMAPWMCFKNIGSVFRPPPVPR